VTGATLYICYYDLLEPLVQTQVLPYLRELARRGLTIHLMTFERRMPSRAQRRELRHALAAEGLRWYPRRYHQRPSLPATAYDIVLGALTAAFICLRHGVDVVHARSHVAAAIAWPAHAFLRRRMLFDVRGLLAEEYTDVGHWRPNGVAARLTRRLERFALNDADAVVVLTDVIRRELEDGRSGAPITVIPCCVDTTPYHGATRDRDSIRGRLGWNNRLVVAYVGKIGTWYLPEETAAFFAALSREDERAFLRVLTQSDVGPLAAALDHLGVPRDRWQADRVTPDQVPTVLAGADAGLSFILPSPSKRASSPTKVAEYLAAGLPVVSNAGIGDCDALISSNQVGVIAELSVEGHLEGARALTRLLADPTLRERCRRIAEEHLSLQRVGGPRYASVYERLLGA
jgi:glycosyltransferase involved in cell wall biosynthesis